MVIDVNWRGAVAQVWRVLAQNFQPDIRFAIVRPASPAAAPRHSQAGIDRCRAFLWAGTHFLPDFSAFCPPHVRPQVQADTKVAEHLHPRRIPAIKARRSPPRASRSCVHFRRLSSSFPPLPISPLLGPVVSCSARRRFLGDALPALRF